MRFEQDNLSHGPQRHSRFLPPYGSTPVTASCADVGCLAKEGCFFGNTDVSCLRVSPYNDSRKGQTHAVAASMKNLDLVKRSVSARSHDSGVQVIHQ